jgi:hypothetical protein
MSLNGEDRKVYEICMQDFRNYLLYLERNHQKLDNSSSPELVLNGEVIGEVISISITNRLFGLHQDLGSTKEITEFIHWWMQWWWRKWQQRTQVVFKPSQHQFNVSLPLESNPFTAKERDEFLQIMTDKLIQYGEICCSSILAEALFKKDIQASQKTEWTTQEKINLISRLQREAREITFTHGVLVFIKPDRSYGLREWRDSGNANKII